MWRLIEKILGKRKELTMEEKIAGAENKYTGMALVTEVLKIEGFETEDGLLGPGSWEAWYYRLIDLCAKYSVDFCISNSGPGC